LSVLRGIRGFYSVVTFGDQVAEVPESVIDEIRSRETEAGYVRLRPRLRPGQRVRFADDSDRSGLLMEYVGADRVKVLLNLLGRKVEMRVWERDLLAA
jgi:hypothetical protein